MRRFTERGLLHQCAEGGQYAQYYPRVLQVSTYGHTIIPFVADPSILATEGVYDLRVNFKFEDTYPCPDDGSPIAREPLDLEALHIWAVGYPDHDSNLDLHGDEAEILLDEEFAGAGLNSATPLRLAVPGFAKDYLSVVLILSMEEDLGGYSEEVQGGRIAKILPFTYSFWAEPIGEDGPLTDPDGEVNWPQDVHQDPNLVYALSQRVYVTGEVIVPPFYELVLDPGAEIIMAGEAAGFRIEGSVYGQGTELDPVQIRNAHLVQDWAGINLYGYGLLDLDYCEIDALRRIEVIEPPEPILNQTRFYADNSSFNFSNTSDSGLHLELARGCQLNETVLRAIGVFNLPQAPSSQIRTDLVHVDLYSCDVGSAALLNVNLVTSNAVPFLYDVNVFGAFIGLRCVGAGTLKIPHEDLEEEEWPPLACYAYFGGRGLTTSGSEGVSISDDVELWLSRVFIEGFEKGLLLQENSGIWLRDSNVYGCKTGVYLYPSIVHADLGTQFEDGENCIDSDISYRGGVRVFNRSSWPCFAFRNYWEINPPTANLFTGNVWWVQYAPVCMSTPDPLGGGQFILGVAGGVAAHPPNGTPSLSLSVRREGATYRFTVEGVAAPDYANFAVFDVSGRRVFTKPGLPAGSETQVTTWDGRDSNGRVVSSGIYFVRVTAAPGAATAKLALIK